MITSKMEKIGNNEDGGKDVKELPENNFKSITYYCQQVQLCKLNNPLPLSNFKMAFS